MSYEVPAYRVELVRTGGTSADQPYCRGPKEAAAVFRSYIGNADREHLVAIFLDARLQMIGIHTISIGDLDHTSIHPREVYKAAILCNAASLVLAHNHPSGDPFPSPDDLEITELLNEAGLLLRIDLIDHVVVGSDRHVSMWELGKLPGWAPPRKVKKKQTS